MKYWLQPKRIVPLLIAVALVLAAGVVLRRPGAPQTSARDSAPIDLAGQWVSVVTEDWRWRMATPPSGDYAGVPLNEEGERVANEWNPTEGAFDERPCQAFGAPAIMRLPGRIRVSWEDDRTLRIETDAGGQSRLFHFGAEAPESSEPSRQGDSVASWQFAGSRPAGESGAPSRNAVTTGGNLKVVTTDLNPGYLRWNGVPFSGETILTEYFDLHTTYGVEWLTVTAVVNDPEYLTEDFIVSSHFRKETVDSNWNPTPCEASPLEAAETE